MTSPVAATATEIAAIHESATQWHQRVQKIQKPEDVFQEKCQALTEASKELVLSVRGSTQPVESLVQAIHDQGVQLKELKDHHARFGDDEDRSYQEQVQEQHKALVLEFGKIIGLSLMTRWIAEERMRIGEQTPSASHQGERASSIDANESTTSPLSDPPPDTLICSRQHEASSPAAESHVEVADNINCADIEMSETEQYSDSEDEELEYANSRRRKRPVTRSETAERQVKRVKKSKTLDMTRGRSIHFDDVFQNGDAQVKYIISRKYDRWVILECKEHKLHFTKNPLVAAANHLKSSSHGNVPAQAVQLLGTTVRGCTERLARKNNAVAHGAFSQGLGFPKGYSRPGKPDSQDQDQDEDEESPADDSESDSTHARSTPAQTHSNYHTRSSKAVCDHINPKPGEIYAGYHDMMKAFYPALILPWGNFNQFGWGSSLANEGLLNEVPGCYIFDKETDKHPQGWTRGYEDGGPLVSRRQYPVIFFNGPTFPTDCHVGWVSHADLKIFDPEDVGLPYRDSAVKFMKSREAQTKETGSEEKEEGGKEEIEKEGVEEKEEEDEDEGGIGKEGESPEAGNPTEDEGTRPALDQDEAVPETPETPGAVTTPKENSESNPIEISDDQATATPDDGDVDAPGELVDSELGFGNPAAFDMTRFELYNEYDERDLRVHYLAQDVQQAGPQQSAPQQTAPQETAPQEKMPKNNSSDGIGHEKTAGHIEGITPGAANSANNDLITGQNFQSYESFNAKVLGDFTVPESFIPAPDPPSTQHREHHSAEPRPNIFSPITPRLPNLVHPADLLAPAYRPGTPPSPSIMFETDDLAAIAAKAMSTLPAASPMPPHRNPRTAAAQASSRGRTAIQSLLSPTPDPRPAVQTTPGPPPEWHGYVNINQAERTPNPARKSSHYFDAILRP